MQNLTAEEKNQTYLPCGLCLHNPVYYSTILPYVLISLPTNGWVLWLMISSPVFWTDKMEVSKFHLVLTEMLFGFLGPPLLAMRFFLDYEVADTVTKLINIIFIARIQFQNCICIERYIAVLRPVLYRRYKPLRYRLSLSCVLWLQAILIGTLQMLFCSEHLNSLAMNRAYFFVVFIFNSICCLSVLRTLRQPSPGEGEREGSDMIKKRAFNIVLILYVTSFVSFLPMLTMLFLVDKIKQSTICILHPLAYSTMVWFGIIHPLHYLHRAVKCFQV